MGLGSREDKKLLCSSKSRQENYGLDIEREWQGYWLYFEDRIKRICSWTGYGVCDKERG